MRLAMFTHIPCDLYSRNEGRWANAEKVGRRRCGNCWSKQALDSRGGACCAKRGTIKALCWGVMKWQFHGRTMIRRCVQTERLLKTDLSIEKHLQPRLEAAEKYCQVIEAKVWKNESKGYFRITSSWSRLLHPRHFQLLSMRVVFFCSYGFPQVSFAIFK